MSASKSVLLLELFLVDEIGEMASFNVNSEDDLAVVVDVSLENALDLGRYTDAPNRDAVVVVVAAFSFVLVILMLARVQDYDQELIITALGVPWSTMRFNPQCHTIDERQCMLLGCKDDGNGTSI